MNRRNFVKAAALAAGSAPFAFDAATRSTNAIAEQTGQATTGLELRFRTHEPS